jgi:hypothetical protein
MPSLIHDALSQLFRNRPTLAPKLLRDVLNAAVPVVREAAVAELSPELAVLSVMLHGRGEYALAIAQAALAGARGLDDERAKLYADLVFTSVDEITLAIMEALMVTGNYEYQSDFARRYLAQGKVEGRSHALLAVFAARGLEVPERVRAQITACVDFARLDAWLAGAVTATSAAEAVRE